MKSTTKKFTKSSNPYIRKQIKKKLKAQKRRILLSLLIGICFFGLLYRSKYMYAYEGTKNDSVVQVAQSLQKSSIGYEETLRVLKKSYSPRYKITGNDEEKKIFISTYSGDGIDRIENCIDTIEF